MSNQQDYAAKQAAALALAKDAVQEPRIPMGIYIQEAEDLLVVATADVGKLKVTGLSDIVLKDIAVCAGACREAQSIWMRELQTKKDAEELWVASSPKAFELRDFLLHSFRFAFRKDGELTKKVEKIAEGAGNADMIQDLNDLSIVGKNNQSLLKAIGFDFAQLDKAATMSGDMAKLLSLVNGERISGNASKEMRDRMYTLMKQAVDEVRECGKYVFF